MRAELHWIPLLPILGAVWNLLVGRKLPRGLVHAVAYGTVGAAFCISLDAFLALRHHPDQAIHETWFTWMSAGGIDISAGFLYDRLSAVMCFIVTGVGFLIHVYSMEYMSHDETPARFFGYLNLFTGAMLILVLGDNLLLTFVGWEGVGVCSYLLIGYWYNKEANATAGKKAFITNRVGDFAFLIGIFILVELCKTLDYGQLREHASALRVDWWWGKPAAFAVAFCLFIGACGKSAQIPLYVWLPDAMAGPTPVSALIHAATMVTAGVYMVARLSFIYAMAPEALAIVAFVGALTALFAATIGCAQTDIKKVLAYSTISQLGFMFAGVAGEATASGVFHLGTHAFFKAGLFLGAGAVMHAMADRTEIMGMGGLAKKTPILRWTFFVYCVAIAGIFPLAGFWSKDAILSSVFHAHWGGVAPWLPKLVFGMLLLTAGVTAFYMFRLYYLVFSGETRSDAETYDHAHDPSPIMWGPLAILAGLALVAGVLGVPGHDWVGNWLDPVTRKGVEPEIEAHMDYVLAGLGLLAGITGIAVATALYHGGPKPAVDRFVAAAPGVYEAVKGKYWVDEAYALLFVRPLRAIAAALHRGFDVVVIDGGLVHGPAKVVDVVAQILRPLQNGEVQRYVAMLLVGTAIVLGLALREAEPPAPAVTAPKTAAAIQLPATGEVPR